MQLILHKQVNGISRTDSARAWPCYRPYYRFTGNRRHRQQGASLPFPLEYATYIIVAKAAEFIVDDQVMIRRE